MNYCLKRKNKKRFFSFQSMPNLNFAELIIHTAEEVGDLFGQSCIQAAPLR